MSLGIKSSAFLRVFTMGSWIHDGFLDSRWVLVFTMGSWVHDKVHVKSLDFFEPCAKAAKKYITGWPRHVMTSCAMPWNQNLWHALPCRAIKGHGTPCYNCFVSHYAKSCWISCILRFSGFGMVTHQAVTHRVDLFDS